MKDDIDFENITNVQNGIFGGVAVLFILGNMVPFGVSILVDELKAELSVTQAISVVAKLFELPHDSMLSTPTGMFVQLIMKVFQNLNTLLPGLYGGIIPVMVEVFIAVLLVLVLHGPIGLIQLVLFIFYTVVAYRAAAAKAMRNREMMKVMMSEWANIMDSAGSYERAHFFGNVEHEVETARESFEKIAVRVTEVSGGEHKEGMMLNGISLVVTTAFVFIVLGSDTVTGIEMLALVVYFSTFSFKLIEYATAVSNLRTAVFEYQAFDDFLTTLSSVADIEDATELTWTPNPTIEFTNVSFSYGDKLILDDVSFKVDGGDTLGLVGSSGCGKSTVLRLLMRFYRHTSGTITVDGHDVNTVTAASLRRLFSVVTQDAQIFNQTIRDNIAYGKMGSSDDEIIQAASRAELGVTAQGTGITLDTVCGEKGAKISGGQQQRVALARAMLKNGSIYLLDEPTTGLDRVVAQQLQGTLDTLSTNATTIMITHHLKDLSKANQIIYLDQGKIVERGSYADLVAAGGPFAKQVEANSE